MFLKDFANNREKIYQVVTNQFFVVYNVVCWKIQKSAGILEECIIIIVVPSHFFVLLNLYGFPNIEAKVSLKVSKMSLDRAIKCILSYSRDSSLSRYSVPLNYTANKRTSISKKLLAYNDNENVITLAKV